MSELDVWHKGGVTAEYRPSTGELRIYAPDSNRVLGEQYTRELVEFLRDTVFLTGERDGDGLEGDRAYLESVAALEPPTESTSEEPIGTASIEVPQATVKVTQPKPPVKRRPRRASA